MPINLKRISRLALACLIAAPLSLTHADIDLELLGTYSQPDPEAAFDESAAEIVAFDKKSESLFVTNGNDKTIDIIDISDPTDPFLVDQINVTNNQEFDSFLGGGANSVAVARGLVAAAIEADIVTDPGAVAFFDTDGNFLSLATMDMRCALPDMITFTPNGKTALVACEGEPDDGIDPEGAVAIIDVRKNGKVKDVKIADFQDFNGEVEALRNAGVRLFPDVGTSPPDEGQITVSQDLEPEYIGVDDKGRTAYVVLQEANAVAVVDIKKGIVTEIRSLGTKDHSIEGFGLDPSDRDDGIAIAEWPVKGLFLPDAIDCYKPKGKGKGKGKKTYCITANEGDDRGDADEADEPDENERGDAIRFKDIADVTSFGRGGLEPSDALASMDLACR